MTTPSKAEKVQRYEMEWVGHGYSQYRDLVKNPDGEVVAYDDYAALEAELQATRRALELAAAYTDVDSFYFMKKANDERAALPDPPTVADSKRGEE